jgi:transcriptional regulator with XRE-family HTH domain
MKDNVFNEASFYSDLGGRIARARDKAGIDQAHLGRMVGLSRSSISNIEGGRHALKAHLLIRICQVLGVTPADLLPEARVFDESAAKPKVDAEIFRRTGGVVDVAVHELRKIARNVLESKGGGHK